jgi:ribosomal protein S27AE
MARFRCRGCGAEGSRVWAGRRNCPRCGSAGVQFAYRSKSSPMTTRYSPP